MVMAILGMAMIIMMEGYKKQEHNACYIPAFHKK